MTERTINVDEAEIKKFADLAHRWWDPNSEFKPLHQINPLRLDFIDQKVRLKGKKVLDVGCGGGILAEGMAQRGATVSGIDMGETPLEVARLHLLESGLEVDYKRIPVEQLAAEQPESFDTITCMEMLEHVPDPASIVMACARLTKPGGHLFFSTLNRNPKSYLFAIVGAEYILKMLPKGTHEFAKFIRPGELDTWIRAAGLETESITGMIYNPFNQQYRLDTDISVNYMVSCHKGADE